MKKNTILKQLSISCLVFMFSIFSYGQDTALSFDGTPGDGTPVQGVEDISGQFVHLEPMIPFLDSFTVMGWVDVDIADSNIFVWGCLAFDNYAAIQVGVDFKLRFYIPGIGNIIESNTNIEDGWHHIAITNNQGTITIYIDGQAENFGDLDLSQLAPTISTFGTGLFSGTWDGFGGATLDDFTFWALALSQSEIEYYFNFGALGTESGIIAAYDFDFENIIPGGNNSDKKTLKDATGKHQGTLYGFPLTGTTGNWVNSQNAVLSTTTFKNDKEVKVYPNPTSDFIEIANVSDNASYEIYNVLGAKVLSSNLKLNKKIDVTSLVNGVYFINVNNSKSLKFIKR